MKKYQERQLSIHNIVLTGGGTGGHLAIVNELKKELNSRGIRPVFIGSTSGQDMAWFEHDHGFKKVYFLDSRGVMNKGFFGKISSLVNIYSLTSKVKEIFVENNVNKIVSVGGYSAAPAAIAAIFNLLPLYIHEQNAKMGMLNKLLSIFAKEIFSSYGANLVAKDYPVNQNYFESGRIRDVIQTVIFLGGSQGAKSINDFAITWAPKLHQKGIHIIHQTGKNDFERVSKTYQNMGLSIDVFAFDNELYKKMAKADFAVSRAGASTLWELSANALPTLFVPYPYAAANHQFYNAKYLVDKNLAFMVSDMELKNVDLNKYLTLDLHKISTRLTDSIMIDGVKIMVDRITE